MWEVLARSAFAFLKQDGDKIILENKFTGLIVEAWENNFKAVVVN